MSSREASENVREKWRKLVELLQVANATRGDGMAQLLSISNDSTPVEVIEAMKAQTSTGSHQSRHLWPLIWQLRVDKGPEGPACGLAFLEFTIQVPTQQTASLRLVTSAKHSAWVLEGRGAITAWSNGLQLLERFSKGNMTRSGSMSLIVPLHDDVVAAAIAALVREADRIEELLNKILTGK